jgi:hypothetical protein
MALSGAVAEAVTGRWLSGCWATFIGVVFSLELPILPLFTAVYQLVACSLPGNPLALFI